MALIAAVWLAIGNLTHPVGSTEIYTDGVAFVEHTNTYWVINHVLLALALTVTPWLAWAWGRQLSSPVARTWGSFGVILAALGTVIGVFHLAGLDGVALPAFGQVLGANTLRRAEGGVVTPHRPHVGMARHRPEPRPVVLVDPVDWIVVTQPGERLVGKPLEKRVVTRQVGQLHSPPR